MRATLQWDAMKTLLKDQYGVPDGITDQIDNIMRLQYRDAWGDKEQALKDEAEEGSVDDLNEDDK